MQLGLKGLIRVLVAEDSPLMSKMLTSLFDSDPQILVVGVAQNGKIAVEMAKVLKPDIITMDIHMPIMDGFEATKEIMKTIPTPIIVISTSVFKDGMNKAFKSIALGALDVVEKGWLEEDREFRKDFVSKLKELSQIKVLPLSREIPIKEKQIFSPPKLSRPYKKTTYKIVAITASTGGPGVLMKILKNFPPDFPCSVVIVQHIMRGFDKGLVDWLNEECNITVKLGEDSEVLAPATAYLAPCDVQMRVEEGKICLSNDPPFEGHKPSGNVLLESVARCYRSASMGVILTGMGKDGALGMKAIKESGGFTIAQDEKTSVIFGMPKAAIELGVVDKVLPVEKIGHFILETVIGVKE